MRWRWWLSAVLAAAVAGAAGGAYLGSSVGVPGGAYFGLIPYASAADEPGEADYDSAAGGPGGVIEHGQGTFTVADGSAPRVGAGRVLRYRAEVEDGIGQDPAAFAVSVDRILADPRGWTAKKRWSFQRSPAVKVDFVVRLASPSTVDKLCGSYGLDTEGEASCRGGENVVINLRRWLLAIPAYEVDVGKYRHLVINHEIGHFLGLGHASCPGPGEPAPVMQTQMYGLDGCVPNAWPYPDAASEE